MCLPGENRRTSLLPFDARHVETELSNPLEDRLVVRARLVVDDDVETALAQQLLALPDEFLVLEGQPLVLVRGEVGVVVARVDVAVLRVVSRLFGDDVADVDRRCIIICTSSLPS